nr:DUF3422 domain-containing protein [Pseudomaricurvus alkylphenolicus]
MFCEVTTGIGGDVEDVIDAKTADVEEAVTAPAVDTGVSLRVDPRRAELYDELHNRPSPLVDSPCLVTHMAVVVNEKEREQEGQFLAELCQRFSINPPSPGVSCFYQNFGGFELRWERHLEFSTYTLIRARKEDCLFEDSALKVVPRDWLERIPGQLITAIHVSMIGAPQALNEEQLCDAFEGQRVCGSQVAHGRAEILTSFRIHSDGFSRCVIRDRGLSAYQAGRLLQRVLEIETYRLMALLGLPTARELAPRLRQLEEFLAKLNQRIAAKGSVKDDGEMLSALTNLAAQAEKIRSDTNYRFGATNAYYDLVTSRLEQLNEQQLPGLQTWQEFVQRRLGPGIKTCNAIQQRLEDLSRRVAHTSGLLRTRVDLSIASQNSNLLSSLDRRSSLQLRLQQTVEGLSVAAIAYYVMGLLNYIFVAAIDLGLPINKTIAMGASVPIVVLLIWASVHGLVRTILKGKEEPKE